VRKRKAGTARELSLSAQRRAGVQGPGQARHHPATGETKDRGQDRVDFAALFRRPLQDPEDPEDPDAFERPTPRQAAALDVSLGWMSEQVGFDIEEHEGQPVTFDNRQSWALLAALPVSTWRRKLAWRGRFRACIDDLIGDLEAGEAPIPRCVGEEVALRLAIEEVSDWGKEDLPLWKIDELPADPDDDQWGFVLDSLFQDLDVDVILWPGPLEGLWEDPVAIDRYGPADYRPAAWFEWFLNVAPRPGR
jgi:hypothetical protein